MQDLVLFFKIKDEFFGSSEEGRLVFAKLKNDTEDDPMAPGFKDEAKFIGINLIKAFSNSEDSLENIFSNKDIPKIKVCDRDDVLKVLLRKK